MEKLDLKKTLKDQYAPNPQAVSFLEIPKAQFLRVHGRDARPESPGFQKAIEELFGLSYKLKFYSKNSLGRDYVVMPLEGLWWADDMEVFKTGQKDQWRWTLMIRQPDWITPDLVQRFPGFSPQLETWTEGPCAQILHIGPFSTEGPSIERIHQAIEDSGSSFRGEAHKHHEIYLSDFRKVAPEKMKTILRQSFGP